MKILLHIFISFLLSNCSSYKEKVISRIDNRTEKPKWASLETSMYVENQRVYAVGISEGSIDSRISALSRIADNNARFEISRTITNEASFIFQNIEEGTLYNEDLSRFYGNELTKYVSHGVRQEKRYWEKIETINSFGEKVFNTKVYSLVSIKESDLKKAIRNALNKERKITTKIKNAIDDHITKQIQMLER